MLVEDIKEFLDVKYDQYNHAEFIETDPIRIPHSFYDPNDIEIAGFFAAIIAWGQRNTIIKNGLHLLQLMDNQPYDFIINSTGNDFKHFRNFKHRTFNYIDTIYFIKSLKNIYNNHGGIKAIFENNYKKSGDLKNAIIHFRKIFFEISYPDRTLKHISDINKRAAAKRINMFLRWMIRKDNRGVDFGIWNNIPASALYIPLDVHTGSVSRKLGLLKRKQNDWYAVEELTEVLRKFDRNDPVKYDFALFGLGVRDILF
ncbi:MAG: TIGR02757 family protein [Bacteroidales bacterium]|nr:MAG: TIGR02757 family protein [Bacteroidales bacterium]